jgi:nitrate/TMAO reductase-like tetraheme cytochrome c subunit
MKVSLVPLSISNKKKIYILIILAFIFVPSVLAYNYFENDPRSCLSCHLMNPAYDAWDHSAMHDIKCHTCHEANILVNINHIIKVTVSDPEEVTTIAEVENQVCENCHVTNDPSWLQIADTIGHKVHFYESQNQPDCIDCHGLQLHVFEPPEEVCNKCHDETLSMDPEELNTHCIACHEFTEKTDVLRPHIRECLECHTERTITKVSFPTGAHEDTECMVCHNPHTSEQHTPCISCHDVKGNDLHALESHPTCESCHTPHSSEEIRGTCLECHTDKQDHFTDVKCASCHRFGL